MKKLLFYISAILLFMSSCSYQNYIYLRDKDEQTNRIKEYKRSVPTYRIQPHDMLMVNINSINEEVEKLFQKKSQEGGSGNTLNRMQGQGNSMYFSSYYVNNQGKISLPILGEIKVAGKTIEEVRKFIAEEVNKTFESTTVDVKFVSFKVTFVGELDAPGEKTFYTERLDIFSGIEQAGGISRYGDRKNVLIVRSTTEGMRTFRVDLTERDLLSSHKYYLHPNDMVYVEARWNKMFQMDTQDFFFYISTITSLLTTALLIVNLGK